MACAATIPSADELSNGVLFNTDYTASSKYRVLVTDTIDQAGIDILKSVAEVDYKTKLTETQICGIIEQYDALLVRSGTQVNERIIAAGKRLRIIGRAGVGVDNVDVKIATENGIFVVNSPLGNTVAAAEHTLALMLSLCRHVAAADASVRDKQWNRAKFIGTQLQHKVLGIVGLGQVGTHVAKVAREMGMELLTYDPFVNEEKAGNLGCTICTLDQLLRQSDFVTLHVPLIDQTYHMINKDTLALMKPTARLINVSRGGVVHEEELCSALRAGRLAGAALDVFEVEKALPQDSPLLHAPNLLLTPHLGASTAEAQVNVAVDVAHQIQQTLLGRLPESAVNIPAFRAADMERLGPFVKCCDVLGRVAAQLLAGPIDSIEVTQEGHDYCEEKGEPLLLAAANGALSMHVAHRVNFVNVRKLAEHHKIHLKLSKEQFHRKNSFRVELRNKEDKAVVRGTSGEDGEVLLKSLKGFPLYLHLPECSLENPVYMFYSLQKDAPGVLAHITAVLQKSSINVANCHLSRLETSTHGRMGMCIFHIDGPASEDLLKSIRTLPHVHECKWCLAPYQIGIETRGTTKAN